MSTEVSEVRATSIISAMIAGFVLYTSDPFALGSLIALVMEAARTSETSVDIKLRTLQYIPEDSELHTRRRENLKSHTASSSFRAVG
jgi:hypothetical protein